MTQENKELLIRDLCARFPYGVKCNVYVEGHEENGITEEIGLGGLKLIEDGHTFLRIKPYLRKLSSMTEEEYNKYHELELEGGMEYLSLPLLDWLNAHYFDYRGLIEKGLAIEAPKGMYNE